MTIEESAEPAAVPANIARSSPSGTSANEARSASRVYGYEPSLCG
jgi:hypothetical protein